MEVLKLLSETYRLSKDEFFQLIDLQLKMNQSMKQTSPGITSSVDGLGSGTADLEKLLRATYEKMENQQKQQHQMFAAILDQQRQYLQNEFQNFQKQLLQQQYVQLKQHQHTMAQQNELLKCNLSGKFHGSLDPALLDMKEKFHEMRNTVLNQLEEQKGFMRDALSKDQNDVLTLLSKIVQEVNEMKEAMAQNEKKVGQICLLCEELSGERNQQGNQDESTEGAGSSQVNQDSVKILLEDMKIKIEDKLEQSVDSLKQEITKMKDSQLAEIPNKVVQDNSMQKNNPFPYYFCVNNFQNCIKHEESVESNLIYVDKLGVYMKGYVQFFKGVMEVWISYVSNPTADYNVQPLPVPNRNISVKVDILDITGKLPGKDIGEKLFSSEAIYFNNDRPFLIGTAKNEELITDGYVLHFIGAVLLRYAIVVRDAS